MSFVSFTPHKAYLSVFVSCMLIISMLAIPSFAQAASCQIPKTYYKHVSCTSKKGYYLAVTDAGTPVALIDKNSKEKVNLRPYSRVAVDKISAGLLPVQRGKKVGYINMRGKEVIPTRYDILADGTAWARPVRNGRIVVKKNGRYGVISTNNRVVVPFSSKYVNISDYRANTTTAKLNNKTTVTLNTQGKTVKTDKNTSHNKNATLTAKQQSHNKPSNSTQSSQNRRNQNATKQQVSKTVSNNQGRQNQNANTQTNRQQANGTAKNTASKRQSAPQSAVAKPMNKVVIPLTEKYIPIIRAVKRQGKWGFVDMNNKVMIEFIFDDARPFSRGIAGVQKDGKWGFIDLAGNLVIDFQFDNDESLQKGRDFYKNKPSFSFINGKAWVGYQESGDKQCIDLQGELTDCDE